MCGIAGILATDRPDDRDRVARMIAAIAHRGPNGQAVRAFPGAVLGFARLSIIDLSERAMQPMVSADGRHVLVFNGEIYNYRELRVELAAGDQFRTESDSEVLLAAYRRWGQECLQRLNGMFAFCIYDTQTREAFLARDRFGQKPLYLARRGNSLLFGSEVKALLAGGIAARPDRETWARYLVTASYDDSADSYFAGITQLMPGECVNISGSGQVQRSRYYRVEHHIEPRTVDVATAARHTREIMIDACRIHMRADVPVSVMLSGGLDSSSMLACLDLAGELNPQVKCFSVEFGPDLTERPWIEAAAGHHGLPTRIDTFTPERFRETIKPMMWHFEGPLGGLMICALDDVVRACRDEGFVVLQDGSGLDECFAGYRNHHNLYVGSLLKGGDRKADQAVAEYAANWGIDETAARHAAMTELERAGTTVDGSVPVRPDLLAPDILAAPLGHVPPSAHSGDPVRDALIDYLQVRKIPRNTRMYDRLSMAYGLELRLPFLDHRLVEFSLSMPSAYYFLHGRTKGIVREAMKGHMDDDVRIAKKRSIQAPQGAWLMREPMRSYVEELLDSDSFGDRGLFDVKKAKAAFARFCHGEFDNSFFVWQWINTEEWYRMFIDVDPMGVRQPLCPSLQQPLPSVAAPEPVLQ
jgi:asparagine synthase (glutamine-hydrolysing)